MKPFKQHVKEIKNWMLLAKAGVIVMIFCYVPTAIIAFLDIQLGIKLNLASWIIELLMYMLLFGFLIYGSMFIIAGIGIDKRNRCSVCGKKFRVKELEQMDEKFHCPHCHNEKFGKSSDISIIWPYLYTVKNPIWQTNKEAGANAPAFAFLIMDT